MNIRALAKLRKAWQAGWMRYASCNGLPTAQDDLYGLPHGQQQHLCWTSMRKAPSQALMSSQRREDFLRASTSLIKTLVKSGFPKCSCRKGAHRLAALREVDEGGRRMRLHARLAEVLHHLHQPCGPHLRPCHAMQLPHAVPHALTQSAQHAKSPASCLDPTSPLRAACMPVARGNQEQECTVRIGNGCKGNKDDLRGAMQRVQACDVYVPGTMRACSASCRSGPRSVHNCPMA